MACQQVSHIVQLRHWIPAKPARERWDSRADDGFGILKIVLVPSLILLTTGTISANWGIPFYHNPLFLFIFSLQCLCIDHRNDTNMYLGFSGWTIFKLTYSNRVLIFNLSKLASIVRRVWTWSGKIQPVHHQGNKCYLHSTMQLRIYIHHPEN